MSLRTFRSLLALAGAAVCFTAAACLGCHDSQAAAAHAFVNTAPFGEACAACHGPNADFSVDKVHAD